jgi:large subunit ribosomal protein L4
MPDIPVLGVSAGKTVKLKDAAFGARFHGPLVHQSVRAEQAARRRGTASTKTRGMVSGGGAKPWRQKGTGRARAGSSRSPIWTGGGTVFGPQPRSYTFKVNRKEQRAALRSALSLHAQRGSIAVLDAAAFAAPKTSQAADLLDDWGQAGPTLVVLAAEESAAALSFRNLARVAVLTHENVGVADLVGAASLVLSQSALEALTVRAGGSSTSEEVRAPGAKAKVAKAKVAKTSKTTETAKAAEAETGAAEPAVTAESSATEEAQA